MPWKSSLFLGEVFLEALFADVIFLQGGVQECPLLQEKEPLRDGVLNRRHFFFPLKTQAFFASRKEAPDIESQKP